MSESNRSRGWTYAKLSGHENEEKILKKINSNNCFIDNLSKRLNIDTTLKNATVGGLNEHNVLDVFGGKTKSKTDLVLEWIGGKKTNISIKKSKGGQVFLINVKRFVLGFEYQFSKKVPDNVQKAIRLFIGGDDDIQKILANKRLHIINKEQIKIYEYELRKNRLTWQTLKEHNNELTECLIDWLKLNIKELVLFCFQRGLAKNKDDWADYVWYHNAVQEEVEDNLHIINEMSEELTTKKSLSQIKPGPRNGGTTILLPFGFLQWHQAQMQFHHTQKVLLKNCSFNKDEINY